MSLTNVQIKWLRITNFKGIESLQVDFSINAATLITGPNGSGKTTISDAYHWLLTGKDSLSREKFGIKSTTNTSLNKSDHEVEGLFIVNGEEQKLKRVYREIWAKPTGQPTAVYKGNEQKFAINDVPMQAGEFDKRISEFLPSAVFKILSNPGYFPKLPWQEQREIITKLAGNLGDTEMLVSYAHGGVEYQNRATRLLDILNAKKSFEDYKKQISAEKKLKKDRLDELPGRIDEQTRTMPESVDYTSIEAQISEKQSAVADIETLINDETFAFNEKNRANNAKQQKISALELDIIRLENEIKTNAQRAGNDRQFKIDGLKNQIQTAEVNLNSKTNLKASIQTRIDADIITKADLLAKWHVENKRTIEIDEHVFECPTCKRALEAETIEEVRSKLESNFKDAQTVKKSQLAESGKKLQLTIAEDTEMIATLDKAIAEINTTMVTLRANLETENVPVAAVNVDSLIAESVEIKNINAQIFTLKGEIEDLRPTDTSAQRQQIANIKAEIVELQTKLSGKDQRQRMQTRINELQAEQTELGQQIASLEGIEYDMQAFENFKIEETNKKVSQLFKIARFKMFNKTISGDLAPTCEVMKDGVPYGDLNTAGKVQIGIDIISALSQFYGLQCPVLIDGKESITELPNTDMQVICLKVGGIKLTIE